jgi:predicted nucleotidyltransferase
MYTDKDIFATLQKFKEVAEENGLNVYACALKGSQNYNLQDEDSDIDANIVFIPTIAQLRENKKFHFSLPEGDVTCHNLYAFADIVAKGNPQWVEVCQTKYIIGDLRVFKDFKINPSALKGMMMEKVVAFDKLYPSRKVFIDEFGYDPKQLHHIIRLYDVLEKGVNVYSYTDAEKEHMLDIKRGRFPETKEQAFALRDEYVQKVADIYESKKLMYKVQKVDYNLLDEIYVEQLLLAFGKEWWEPNDE